MGITFYALLNKGLFCFICCVCYLLNTFADIILSRVQKTIKDFWTMEQIDALINVAPNFQLRVILALMAYAGIYFIRIILLFGSVLAITIKKV